ncbi:leucine-rich repeat domain-containing protein [Aquimarina algicola]|uniref:Leucine-rich repeat domain-containing protein n=1 Tax=Aquimarina algicola TaxID=2589995 RepID=A0A504J9M8_9FLAO|nr:leucine-rich repeat domain-containing protein [Aquimarina algicola]TPN82891.1 leucine-rich repeat domain-containing protein [Aquimarina algicola]
MKITYLLTLFFITSFCFGQNIEEQYKEALYNTEYNNNLQRIFDDIVEIKPIFATGDDNKVLNYTLQPKSDFIITRIAYRIIGTLPDDDLEKDGSIERVVISDLIGTHQFKPKKFSIYLNYYDEKLDERTIPDYPKTWKEMDMELDIISLSFKSAVNEESKKYIKRKRSISIAKLKNLIHHNPELKNIRLTSSQKAEIKKSNLITITKNINWSHKDFDCNDNEIEILKLNRIWGDDFLQGAMYNLPECIESFDKLKKIRFSNHEINEIPEYLSSIKTLEIISLPKNKISSLPKNLEEFTSLKEIDVADNFILNLPETVFFPLGIVKINLSNNYLTKVPKQIYKLKYLTYINLKGNRIPEKDILKLKKKLKNCEIIY